MKAIANLWKDSKGNRGIVLVPDDPKLDIESTPLYAIDFTKFKVVPLEPTEEILEQYPSMAIPALKGYWKTVIEATPDIEDL